MLDIIKDRLRADGLTCYDAAEKIGECRAPYVICYDGGLEVQPGTKGMLGRHSYEVVCLTPFDQVDALPRREARARALLRAIPGLTLSSTGGTGVEQTFKARAVSMVYYTTERIC
jgi:hypothetical protein